MRRVTHLDYLADKLREDRVRRVVEPMLSGVDERRATERDVEYVRDLGLIARDRPARIANPIYAEVVPRELGGILQEELDMNTTWYVDADGGLNLDRLLEAFQDFFRRHSEHWKNRFLYEEAWPQILLQAYLHRVMNRGGRIEREYGLGRGRVDLLIRWPESRPWRGRGAGGCASTWWSARWCAPGTGWRARSPRAWSRPRATWTAARRRRGIWW